MNRFDTTKLAGYPANMRMVAFMNEKSNDGHNLLAEMFGDNVILWGVQHVGSNVTAGAIIYNGELLEFKAGIWQSTFLVQEAGQATVVFADLSSQTIYYDRYAECGIGAGAINLTDLSRAPNAEREWGDFAIYSVDWTNIDLSFDKDSRGKYYIRGSAQYTGANLTNIAAYIGTIISGSGAAINEFFETWGLFNQDNQPFIAAIQKTNENTYELYLLIGGLTFETNDIVYFNHEFYLKT